MYSLALRMVGNPSAAEDMVQDTFIKVMDKITQYRGESSFWWWIRRILTNHCITYLRKNARWVHQDQGEIETILDNLTEIKKTEFENFGLNREISQLFGRLPEQAQRVVYLYVVEGMTHKEIAEIFGQSASFSKSLVSRSLKNLRQWIKS